MTLTEWRKLNKVTMMEIALRLKVSQATISRIEAGKQWPDRSTLARIMDATQGAVTANDFIQLTDERTPSGLQTAPQS